MTTGERLRNLQRQLYEANERRIRQFVSAPRRFERNDLDVYERELNESVRSDFEVSSPGALRGAIRRARIVLVGDYHTLRQSQRGFLRVVRATRTRDLTLALEFVTANFQRAVDAYMDGSIGDDVFLRRIDYARSWPSYQVWPNFKPIFDLARSRGAQVLALDCDSSACASVFSRDGFMAWRIVEALREAPRSKIIVLVGEAHLAPGHLPAELRRSLERIGLNAPILTIHQNVDEVWFNLVARDLEDRVDVVRLAPDRYVAPASTPIAAQQSFLAAVEGQGTPVAAGDRDEVRREFSRTVRLLSRLLGLPSRGLLDDVTVCGPGDLDEIAGLAERVAPEEWRAIATQISEVGESLCLPEYGMVYLANLTPTHLAEEAAHFLKARLAGGHRPVDPCDFLYSRALHEVVGYFGAKLFNPKRKPPSMTMLREAFLQSMDIDQMQFAPELAFAAQIAAWHRKQQWRRSFTRDSLDRYLRTQDLDGIGDLGPEVVWPVVHFLGYELGEHLYLAFKDGRRSPADIRRLFRTDFEAPGKAFEVYHALARALRSIRLPARF